MQGLPQGLNWRMGAAPRVLQPDCQRNRVRGKRPAPWASINFHGFDWHHPLRALHKDTHTEPQYAHDMKLLVGSWVKDKEVSDSMKPAMNLMALSGIVRQAVKLVRGISIGQDASMWTMSVVSVIGWFKVTERYALDGQPSKCKRRDLRSGQHTGQLLPNKPGPHGGLMLSLAWDDPHGGTGTDEFVLVPRGTAAAQKQSAASPAQPTATEAPHTPVVHARELPSDPKEQELHVWSTLNSDGTTLTYRTVYHR